MKKCKWFSGLIIISVISLTVLSTGCVKISVPRQPESSSTPSEKAPSSSSQSPAMGSPVIIAFDISPDALAPGESAVLKWAVNGADAVSIDQGIGEVPPNGTKEVSPTTGTIYTLTATNAAGIVTRTVAVNIAGNVNAAKIALNEDDVKSGGFVFDSDKEPKVAGSISTYSISFIKGDEKLTNIVFVQSSVSAAEQLFHNSRARHSSNAQELYTIGNIRAFVVLDSRGTAEELEKFSIMFIKNNVYVEMGSISNYKQLESYAKIVTSRIH